MASVKLKGWSGTEWTYDNVPKVWLNAADSTEENEVKVPFTYGEAVQKEVSLDFSEGDMQVPIPEGELVTNLTIKQPDTLIPENIAKDAVVAGIVGEHVGGGGASTIESFEPEWIEDICFWDYDGTLILHIPVSAAKHLTSLPEVPEHTGLVFQEWNYTLEEIQNTTYPLDIGATYITADGHTHAVITITDSSKRAVPLHFRQTVANGVTVYWGDGSSSKSATVGRTSLTHTYSAIGTYEIRLEVADGCIMNPGGGGTSYSFVGGSDSTYRQYLTEVYIGNNCTQLADYAFYWHLRLKYLTIPIGSVVEGVKYLLQTCYDVHTVIIPQGVNALGTYCISGIGSTTSENFNCRISIPATVTTLGDRTPSSLYRTNGRVVIPPGITTLGNYAFSDCRCITRIYLPPSLRSIGNSFAYSCYCLVELHLPEGLQSIGESFMSGVARARKAVIPSTVTSIGARFCYNAGPKLVIIKGTSITWASGYALDEGMTLIFTDKISTTTAVPNICSRLTSGCTAYVPDDHLAACRAVVSDSYKYFIEPHSAYPGEIPTS